MRDAVDRGGSAVGGGVGYRSGAYPRPAASGVRRRLFRVVPGYLYLTMQAGDVALSQLVVGAVALPLIVLLSLAKVRRPHR